jgi:hypothetical protein
MRVVVLVLFAAAIIVAWGTIANAQYRKDRDPDAQVKVTCPTGTCGAWAGGVRPGCNSVQQLIARRKQLSLGNDSAGSIRKRDRGSSS